MTKSSAELLIIPYNVLLNSRNSQHNYEKLTQIVNKSYDKPRFKYGVIQTQRVKHSSNMLMDLGFKKGSFLCLLLCSDTNTGIISRGRRFNSSSDAFDNDLTGDHELDDLTNLKKTVVEADFNMDDQLMARILGTLGFKPYEDDAQSYEITSFTSFYPRLGSKLLDICYNLLNKNQLEAILEGGYGEIDVKQPIQKVYASVIKEHMLVDYYVGKCGFKELSELVLKVGKNGILEGDDLEDGIIASRDFTLAVLYRDLQH